MTSPDIFHVDDDPDFAFFMENAVREVDKKLTIKIVTNGKEALQYLKLLESSNCRPRVILLDYNLPGLSGVDVLVKIREIRFLANVPVIILSTSDNPEHKENTRLLDAESFQTKPMGYKALVDKIKIICDAWCTD